MWVLIPIFIVLLISGTAFAYIIGALSVVSFIAMGEARYLSILPQRIFSQLDVFAYMSLPLFILTAELMTRTGVTRALIDFAMSIVGRLRGGLGHVNILTSLFFAGVSGSAVADSAALSRAFVPEMVARGYPPAYAGAITVASSMIGPIIPPSIIMIIYGGLVETSVAALFVAGVLPGLLLTVALLGYNAYAARIGNHPGGEGSNIPRFWPSLRLAAPALLLPGVIIGSLVFGLATPTEGAAIAVSMALLMGLYYRELTFDVLLDAMEATARLTGMIFIIFCAISVLGYLAGLAGWPSLLGAWVDQLGLTGTGYLLLLVVLFLITGMFMDTPVALTLLVPLMVPLAIEQGVSSVHLGVVLCFNLCIGLVTPPLGKGLVVVSAITGISYWSLARSVLPFIAVQIVVLLLLVVSPEISLFLPRLIGLSVN